MKCCFNLVNPYVFRLIVQQIFSYECKLVNSQKGIGTHTQTHRDIHVDVYRQYSQLIIIFRNSLIIK